VRVPRLVGERHLARHAPLGLGTLEAAADQPRVLDLALRVHDDDAIHVRRRADLDQSGMSRTTRPSKPSAAHASRIAWRRVRIAGW
jgi:hypothetical protein